VSKADTLLEVLKIPLAFVMAAPIGLPFAWFMGLIPALLVGAVYWALRAKAGADAWTSAALSAIAAFIVCAGAIVVIDGNVAGLGEVESWAIMIVPGVVATLGCIIVIERRG
jgi:hypothetical protein